MRTVEVREILRAVDVFLFKFNCPSCGHEQLTGTQLGSCHTCEAGMSDFGLDIESASSRLIVGSPLARRRKGIGKKTVLSLYGMQSGQCAYCDCSLDGEQYHVDHVIPFCIGGTNNFNNLVLACRTCNLIASSKVFPSLMAKRMFVLNERTKRRQNRDAQCRMT